jgi:hypothetical protein
MTNAMVPIHPNEGAEFLLYQADDGQTCIAVRVAEETVWLSQRQLAELFQKSVPTINHHIQSVYEEGELERAPTIRKYLIVQTEGGRAIEREVEFYNLDVIISVGYRVRSHRGTQFRQWATRRLRDYLLNGFVLDDERLRHGRRDERFEALLARVRAIRVSEGHLYRKLTDLFATSVDYDPDHPLARAFFATVQNKLHRAITGHTAAEIIAQRADASRPQMGLTAWRNALLGRICKADIEVAKNYLTGEELALLELLVEQFLTFAEFQARRGNGLRMADWNPKLDAFLTLNNCPILEGAGRVSAAQAKAKAARELAKYDARCRSALTVPTSAGRMDSHAP